jgi:hypothetical protein
MSDILQFFSHVHLPPHLQAAAKPFGELAEQIVKDIPGNAEREVALRKLLEAKDAAVRAVIATIGQPNAAHPAQAQAGNAPKP